MFKSKTLKTFLLTFLITAFNNVNTFAAGGTDDPYHIPEPTGVITEPLFILAFILFTIGLITMLSAKSMKDKLTNY